MRRTEANLQLLSRPNPLLGDRKLETPLKSTTPAALNLVKTRVRNTSYDPICGELREFNTPKMILRSLDVSGAPSYLPPSTYY